MTIQLVPMDKSHLAQVAALEQQSFHQPWSKASLEDELYNPAASLVVAQDENERVLGYGMVRAVLDEGCLEKIAVQPHLRRQGVAQTILNAFLRFGAEHLAFLTLEVRESNAPAIALYEKLGFVQVGRRKNYYAQLKEDALLMTVTFSHEEVQP